MPQSQQAILAEIDQLIAFYGMDKSHCSQVLATIPLDNYVEIVLAEQNFDIVIGEFGQAQNLISIAQKNDFPPFLIQAFEKCVARYPNKMLYAKFSLDKNSKTDTLYIGLMEPWNEVLDFLSKFKDLTVNISQLQQQKIATELCFLLAFSVDKANQLVAKIYHLVDLKKNTETIKPFLMAYRVSNKEITQKTYTVYPDWNQPYLNARWQEINAFANNVFGSKYAIHQGKSENAEIKNYIFRYDKRENKIYTHKNYNYFVEEGIKLLALNKFSEASAVFANALEFKPQDADALNGMALCHFNLGRFLEGIQCMLEAKAINSKISNLVWNMPLQPNVEEEIADLTQKIAENPSPTLYNARGVAFFKFKEFEKSAADFEKALESNPLVAETLNNLAGSYLKLGKFVEALRACHTAISLVRETDTTNLAIAQEALRLARETDTMPTTKNCQDFGIFLYKLDLYEQAQTYFLKAETA